MLDVFLDAVIDSLKILPFLFLTYLLMEYLESRAEERARSAVRKAGWLGPLWGSFLGIVPQCGFSAAAANLYAGRAISIGTLFAIFLSTSDEMLPILISSTVPAGTILRIVASKVLIALLFGFLIDGVCHLLKIRGTGQAGDGEEFAIEQLCEKEHCHCENGSIVRSALKHTLNIFLFVFAVTVALNLAFYLIGEERLIAAVTSRPVLGLFAAALIGLIPNCGASVLLTQMYLRNVLGAGQLIAGLLVGAGVGLLVLFRVNPHRKENAVITAVLYASGVAGGALVGLLGLAF